MTEVLIRMHAIIGPARVFVLASLAILAAASSGSAESRWEQWRGPRGDGHAVEANVPTTWDATSVIWKTAIKGRGQSSPIVWGDRIFLTTALDNGKSRVVMCVRASDGVVLWEQTAWTGEPEPTHVMNGWASATCATNGEIVVAFFGRGGLHAYTVEGKHLWSRDLGPFDGPWSTAACPKIIGDKVIQNGDADADAFIEAFELKTGKTAWKTTRPNHRGWSTPIVWRQHGRDEIVLNGHAGVTSYDPTTGAELWSTKNSNGRGEPTVTPGAESLYVVCGLAGEMYSLRPGVEAKKPERSWGTMRRSGRDLPSPIVVGDYLLVTSMSGIASCYEARSGKELWKERLNGQFSGSPIAVGGLMLHQNEAGETVVIEPGPTLKIVARNTLAPAPDEIFRASLTPVEGRIYSRSDKVLYCIGKPRTP